MKALLCRELGDPGQLVVEEVPDPKPGPGKVLIDVKAAGVNFPDLLLIQGKYQANPELPFTPGGECAGVVSAVGEGVTHLGEGDRVCGSMLLGGFAEKTVIDAHSVAKIPDTMSFEQGAGFTLTYSTSYYALKQCAQLQAGETLLVMGAAGGVGITAVELGKVMGARVIAAASTQEKLETARKAGADEGIEYTSEDLKKRVKELTDGKGVDVVYDPVGGDFSEQALRATNWGGRYLVIGFAAGDIPHIPLNLPLLKGCRIVGVFWGAWAQRDPKAHAKNFAELFAMFEAGKLNPLVTQTYPLADYKEAFACLAERRAQGKVILTM